MDKYDNKYDNKYDEGRRYDDGRRYYDGRKYEEGRVHDRDRRMNWLLPLLAGLLGLGLLLTSLMRRREPTPRTRYAATTTTGTGYTTPGTIGTTGVRDRTL